MAENNDTLVKEVQELTKEVKGSIPIAAEAKKLAEETAKKHSDLIAELKTLNDENAKTSEWRKEAEERGKENQKALNELITDVKTMRENGIKLINGAGGNDFETSLAKAIKDNFEVKDDKGRKSGITMVTKGAAHSFELAHGTGLYAKAAGNMTQAGNLTGDSNITYMPQPVILPRQLINFRDLVPSFQSETGNIVIFRENGGPSTSPQVGGFGQQLTEGALKEQVGYTFTNVPFTAEYISGFVRISKQMLQDLLFLQTYLPQMLLRDYYKYENSTFYTAQVNAALGTHTAGGNAAETFINDIANLETNNFAPNGIVVPPLIWGNLMKTRLPSTGTSYSAPGGFYINPSTGMMEIAGIPIIKATWIAANTALVADWSQSQIATVDGLRVEFFEQDSDNVQRNLITVRVEARVVLITGQPYAFTNANSVLTP